MAASMTEKDLNARFLLFSEILFIYLLNLHLFMYLFIYEFFFGFDSSSDQAR